MVPFSQQERCTRRFSTYVLRSNGCRFKNIDAIETNSELPHNHSQLTDRLLATGAVHPVPDTSAELSDTTVVIPAFITDSESHAHLEKLVASLHGLTVIIVDDASPFSVHLNGVHIIRHDTNKGPAAARNTGIAAVATKVVACVDTDVSGHVTANRNTRCVCH